MPPSRPVDTLVRAARLYYEEGLSQGEVARRLGLSGATVSRMLTAAREQGIVEVRIHDPRLRVQRVPEVEAELVARFGLLEARVGTASDGLDGASLVGKLGAGYFSEHVARMRRVGLSWGSTVAAFVAEVPESPAPMLRLLPLAGGIPTLDRTSAGGTVIQVLARKLGVEPTRLLAPAIVEAAQTRRAIMSESTIRAVLEQAAQVDHAFVGIGAFGVRTSASVVEAMKLTAAESAAFLAAEPAGDLCGQFFDETGHAIGAPTAERVIGVSFEQLRDVPVVVGMAAGADKARGVVGALRSGVVKVAVLDLDLAQAVLQRGAQAGPSAG